jgi:large subunit ribosomal protein L11
MADKPVRSRIKLEIPGGQASPAPPVGPTLGEHGLPIGDFVNRFNSKTEDEQGVLFPVEITVYEDNSFDLTIKSPPASFLLKEAASIAQGSPRPATIKVGAVTRDQTREIAERKMEDLNANDLESATRVVEGTARSMGIQVFESEEEAEVFREEEVVTDLDELEAVTEDEGPDEEEEPEEEAAAEEAELEE